MGGFLLGTTMNKKVLKTMIALVIVFLLACYILKIFFPEQFVMSIENETIIAIGNFIDSHVWANYIFGIITSFITYWLYLCAVCRKWYLKWYEIIIVFLVIGGSIGLSLLDTNIYSVYSVITFIVLPLIFKSDLKSVAIVFSIHSLSQIMSLTIRNLPMYITSLNNLVILILSLDMYFWLLLFYISFNYIREDKEKWAGNYHLSTERKTVEKKEKLQKSIEKSQTLKQIKQSIKNALQKDNLKKNLRKLKLSIKDFITDELWIYVIIIGSIALCSWLFNRWIEGIMFCIAHLVIRRVFNKQFHFNSTAYCLTLTLAIIWFAIPITMPLTTSLLSSIPIAFIVCFFGFIAQDRVDLLIEVKRLDNYANGLVLKLNHKDIYAMNEDELYEHCRNCGLSDVDCKIAYFIVIERLKGKELYQAINYSERQTKRKRKEILDKIK